MQRQQRTKTHATTQGAAAPPARPKHVAALLALAGLAAVAGCGGGEPPADSPPGPEPARAELESRPAGQQFVGLGCVSCHGPEAPYHQNLKASINRPVDEVVRWILDPQAIKPGTEMPSFEGAIEPEEARRLAEWTQEYARTIP